MQGAISNATEEAVELRSVAALALFLDLNQSVLSGPTSSTSLNTLKQIVSDVETVSVYSVILSECTV